MPDLAAALEHLVRGIVDHPDQVRVEAAASGRGEVLQVHVHPDDRGRVIGRGGAQLLLAAGLGDEVGAA
jgi:predicted RNA-binding protein YlqC (UPF0109 family)